LGGISHVQECPGLGRKEEMPGKPAVRTGDTAMDCGDPMDAPTGTVVAPPGTVFINKLPAAKKGDQVIGVDIHIIMIPSPGGPIPTPLPHPFAGIIDGGLESSVKIMGMPAAVVGSTASNTPPHIPQGGPFQKPPSNKAQLIIGSPNVFIGSGSGGGSGGGSGSANGAADGIFPISIDTSSVSSESQEGHFLTMMFVDKDELQQIGPGYKLDDTAGKKSDGHLSGVIAQYGIQEGQGEAILGDIAKLFWSTTEDLTPGSTVELHIETVGIDDGTQVEFTIWERGQNMPDKRIAVMDSEKIQGDKSSTTWMYVTPEHTKAPNFSGEPFSSPDYYFTAAVAGLNKRSEMLGALADIEIVLKDNNNNPIPNEAYILRLSSGEIRKGNLDSDGFALEAKVPPRAVVVEFPGLKIVIEKDENGDLVGGEYDDRFQLVDEITGELLVDYPYRLETESGIVLEGRTDGNGYTKKISSDKEEQVYIRTSGDE
jgi:uncharacterized Zn-binding protein involved in type VI secretion